MKATQSSPLLAVIGLLLASACAGPTPDDHPSEELRFPVSLVADPSGEYLYVANSNFDLAFLGGNIVVIDVDTNRFVPGAAVQLASFAGDIGMVTDQSGQLTSLFVASRDSGNRDIAPGVITELKVQHTGDGPPTLSCATQGPTPNDVPYCAAIGDSPEAPETAGVQTYGLAVRSPDADGRGYLFATAFDGTFTTFRLSADARPERVSQVAIASGAYGVAVHPITGQVYATTKSADRLFALSVDDDGEEIGVEASGISLANPTVGNDFGREIVFNDSGTLAFVAYRTPPSLLVMDTSVGSDGRAVNEVLARVPLASGPAAVAIANSAPDGGELVYVSMYNADQLAVVDPRRLEVVAIIPMGNGPFDVAVVEKPGVKRAYVTLFEENAIGVIDIDPNSVFYHQEIAQDSMKHIAFILALAGLAGCADDVLPATSHLRRPVDLAIVCLQGESGAPLAECTDSGTFVAMIVNAERGSLARLDATGGGFFDDDRFIPGFSPTPLGRTSTEPTRPVAIIALPDGSASFVANLATSNLVRVDTDLLQTLGPGSRRGALSFQELPGRPANIVLRYPEGAPDGTAQELLVALPDQSAVVRVPVETFGEAASLDAILIPDGSPYDLVAATGGDVLYVGHADVAYVSVIDLGTGAETDRIPLADPCFDDLDNNGDGLVDSADYGCRLDAAAGELTEPAGAPAFPTIVLPVGSDLPDCANGVDDDGDGLADFPHDPDCLGPTSALEEPAPLPVLARLALSPDGTLLYAVNARARTVVALDTTTGTRIDVNAECSPGANALLRRLGREDLTVAGVPTDVTFARRPEADGGELLAYVSNTGGGVTVIEVEAQVDGNLERVHRVLDSQPDESQSRLPFPTLFTDTGAVDLALNRRPDFPSFGESVQGDLEVVPVPPYTLDQPDPCPFPEEQPLRTDAETLTDWGIAPAPNDRLAIAETWDITHQGYFLDRTARLGAFVNVADGTFATPERVFCSAGVEVGDTLIIRTPRGLPCGSEAQAVAFQITSVTQHRLTVDPASGREWRDSEGVLVEPALAEPVALTEECFPEPVAYRVRVPRGTYVAVGSVSGYLHPWQAAVADGTCELDPDADPRFVGRIQEWRLSTGSVLPACPPTNNQADAVYEGEWFHNHAFSLRMLPGCTEVFDDNGVATRSVLRTAPEVRWRFSVQSAFGAYGVGGMGTPRSLKWLPERNMVFAVDAGQEKIVAIPTNDVPINDLITAVRTFR